MLSHSIAECEVTEFSAWSPCTVTCGKGLRQRARRYRNPQRAQAKGCNRQLIYKEMCVAAIPECESDDTGEDSSENLAQSEATVNEQGEGLGVCRTTRWSDWSECSGKFQSQVYKIVQLIYELSNSYMWRRHHHENANLY